jgi:nicotinamidase-related amidase
MPLETTRRGILIGTVGVARLLAAAKTSTRTMRLPLRTRVEAFKGSGQWQEVHFEKEFPVAETGLLICDMWDNHWCSGATHRVGALVKVMAPVVDQARAGGIQVIHAPSEVMAFYKDYPQRQRVLAMPHVSTPADLDLNDPPLPIDDAKGGCDTNSDKFYKAWTRQHAAIRIAGDDAISDQGSEIYSLLRKQGIANLLVMGVHTNMCVLKRTFAIRQMTKWGIRCVLVRDLTDSMYDPQTRPYVPHEQGTELVVQHIEKYWCPSVVSRDLTRSLSA